MKLKWTTYTICLIILAVICGCVTHHQLNKTEVIPPMPPDPIKLQKSLELAHKRQQKNRQKIFAASAPVSTNIVLQWPTNIAGVPVVYQIMYDTSISMQNPKLVGETQSAGFVDHIDPAVPNKFYMVQTLAAVTPNVVMLAWDPSLDPAIVGYNIYYGNKSGSYTNKLAVGLNTAWKITTLTQPGTYYFAVTSVTTNLLSDVESEFSSEVAVAVTPVPPQKVTGLVVRR